MCTLTMVSLSFRRQLWSVINRQQSLSENRDYSQNSYSTEKRELQGKSEATYSKANLPNNTQLESKRWHYKLIKSKLKGKVMRL